MENYQICGLEEEFLPAAHLAPRIWLVSTFLWEYGKEKVYQILCHNISQLKRRITSAARKVDADILQNVYNNSQAGYTSLSEKMVGILSTFSI